MKTPTAALISTIASAASIQSKIAACTKLAKGSKLKEGLAAAGFTWCMAGLTGRSGSNAKNMLLGNIAGEHTDHALGLLSCAMKKDNESGIEILI